MLTKIVKIVKLNKNYLFILENNFRKFILKIVHLYKKSIWDLTLSYI